MPAPRRSHARQAIVPALILLVPLGAVLVARAWIPEAPAAPPPAVSIAAASEPTPAEDTMPEIRGHILDAEGNAVDSATVRLVSTSPPFTVHGDTRTDAAGSFSFPPSEPGACTWWPITIRAGW